MIAVELARRSYPIIASPVVERTSWIPLGYAESSSCCIERRVVVARAPKIGFLSMFRAGNAPAFMPTISSRVLTNVEER